MKPTIGRIVHFVDSGGSEFPAIITRVHSDSNVNLQVFRFSDVVARTSVLLDMVNHDQDFLPDNTWHWPQRA